MSILDQLSGAVIIKALAKVGYLAIRQKGSHIRLNKAGANPITVPNHKIVGRGLVQKILRDADLTVEEFAKLL